MQSTPPLQRYLPLLVCVGLFIGAGAFYSAHLMQRERDRFLFPALGTSAKIGIIKDYHSGFAILGYTDNTFLFEMEPDTLKNWLKKRRVTVKLDDPGSNVRDHALRDLQNQSPLSSQDFDFAQPTVELYKSEPDTGSVYVAYNSKTHRGVMREYVRIGG